MQIILAIRRRLRLDERVIELEKEVTNTIGFYPVLLKEYMKEPDWGGCFSSHQNLFSSLDNVFFKHDMIKGDIHLNLHSY
jgi:hypothetical protein